MSKIINRILFYLKKRTVGKIGSRVVFCGDIKFINPKYIEIGDDCQFGPGCRIEAWDKYLDDRFTPSIVFGKDVRINSKCHIGSINRVEIGDECLLGSNVMIIDHSHGRSTLEEATLHPSNRRLYSKGPVKIGNRCWICENVVILPGVTIGEGTVIGANAVVTKDIPAYCVAAGNPARVVRKLQ